MTPLSVFPGLTRDLDNQAAASRGPGSSPGKRLIVAAALFLAACSDAADLPVAAPGNDIVAGDAEGVELPATLESDELYSIEQDAFSADLFNISTITLGMDSDDVEPILQEWADAVTEGEGSRNSSSSVRTSYREGGRTVILATREGLLDDSVAGEQVFAEFTPVGPLSNNLDFVGLRIKCARGANAGEWQTELCP